MKDLTEEWIKKAERDVGTAIRESVVEVDANWDAVCFHAQQAAEKYHKWECAKWQTLYSYYLTIN